MAQTTQVPRTGNGGGREGTACWSTRGGAETRARRVAGGSGRGGAGDQVGWSHRERARGPASAARVVAEARRRQRGAGRPGTVGPRGCWSTRAGGRAAAAGPRGPRGQLVDRIHQEGRREGGARARARARPPTSRAPLGGGVRAAAPGDVQAPVGPRPPGSPPLPRPSPGRAPRRGRRGSACRAPRRARRRAAG